MLRTSMYTIYVDLPQNNNEILLVHGYTGAYDKVSRRVGTYLRSLETSRPPKPLYGYWSPEPSMEGEIPQLSSHSLEILKRRGYLTEMSSDEEEKFFSKVAVTLHNNNQRGVNYIIMPTYDCNLRCAYCFQDHMRTNSHFSHLLRTMRRDMVERILSAMPKIEAQHGAAPDAQPQRNIGFFGGEPLLAQNKNIIEYIVRRAQDVGHATFWAVTNGTELEAHIDILGPGLIERLQITLDGPALEHDNRRIYADGSGSFDRIARNISMALERGVRIDVRMNIDRNNVNQLPIIAQEFVERGWSSQAGFCAYTAPIQPANEHTDIKTTFSSWELDLQINQLRETHEAMSVIARPDDSTKNRARKLFTKQDDPFMRSSFCSAHNGMYIFDAFGDIYACWERTGDPSIRIGYISPEGEYMLEDKFNSLWRSRNVTTNPICRRCRYALYCGGGCAVLAETQRGEFFTNYCDGYGARFRASVAEAYLDHVAGVAVAVNDEPICDM